MRIYSTHDSVPSVPWIQFKVNGSEIPCGVKQNIYFSAHSRLCPPMMPAMKFYTSKPGSVVTQYWIIACVFEVILCFFQKQLMLSKMRRNSFIAPRSHVPPSIPISDAKEQILQTFLFGDSVAEDQGKFHFNPNCNFRRSVAVNCLLESIKAYLF